MADSYIGEIRAVGFNFPPPGWLVCDGSLQQIADYDVLYNLIGTTYGGDGQNTFGIPDLRGRTPIHMGQGNGLSNYVLGQTGGAQTVTLNSQQMPLHTHTVACSDQPGNANSATGAFFANTGASLIYNDVAAPSGSMGSIVSSAGQSLPHENLQPYLGITFLISTQGYYPSPS